ncbi:TIGR01906 family membrane protein [Arthrobacter koreensis]|uniref:TIGR01906 family membrane protein n=1 Tax=Arthrobacter koreensis TaxID=199136 RepID=UPI002DB9E289|nr:TIGR01906 family membrane protein [Arthrobacter koreensis]MEB7505187.1 TIGR01906 family membrane protein [Arthrobacter koreensis]
MRDEAVASQDQDPTTEGVPSGRTPDGRGASPSDASETIVSGTHAAATGSRGDRTAPDEHDAWDAEFSGLAGTDPNPVQPPAASDDGKETTGSRSEEDAAGASAAATESRGGTAAAEAASGVPAAEAGAGASAAQANEASRSAGGSRPGREREEVPGGHPSVAQRSTLPMRAASTMPDLSRYDAQEQSGTADRDESPSARVESPSARVESPSAPHPTAAEGGPWYGPGASEPREAGQQGPGNAAESETTSQAAADPVIPADEAARRSAERERAASARPVLGRIIQIAVAVFFPVMLLAAAIRAVATPVFLWFEYNRPGFPADSFGFSTEDRMTYGSYAVDYLLNFASPRYLGDLVTPDGDPLYLASEVSHMADVKTVLTLAFVTALGMALLSFAGGIYLARRCPGGIRRALFAGAVATLAIIAGLLVAAVLAWEEFFTMVHNIFFAQGNWTFRLDDTLIRLFPAQFWMDAGAAIAAIVLLVCVLVMVFTWPTKKRRERSRLAREESRRRYLESLDAL